jgi:hypothetical protein
MKQRFVIFGIIMIVIILCGCIYTPQVKPTTKKFNIGYSIVTEPLLQKNGRNHNGGRVFIGNFTVPENTTELRVFLSWHPVHDGNFNSETDQFNYSIELVPPNGQSCSCLPSNKTYNHTDLNLKHGELNITCKMNLIPKNSTINRNDIEDVSGMLIVGNSGMGLWNMTIKSAPWSWCGNSQIWSEWNLTIEASRYHSEITRIK